MAAGLGTCLLGTYSPPPVLGGGEWGPGTTRSERGTDFREVVKATLRSFYLNS